MFRSPVRRAHATDAQGRITGERFHYEALDDEQRIEIAAKIPRARITDRGGLIEVFVPIHQEWFSTNRRGNGVRSEGQYPG